MHALPWWIVLNTNVKWLFRPQHKKYLKKICGYCKGRKIACVVQGRFWTFSELYDLFAFCRCLAWMCASQRPYVFPGHLAALLTDARFLVFLPDLCLWLEVTHSGRCSNRTRLELSSFCFLFFIFDVSVLIRSKARSLLSLVTSSELSLCTAGCKIERINYDSRKTLFWLVKIQ